MKKSKSPTYSVRCVWANTSSHGEFSKFVWILIGRLPKHTETFVYPFISKAFETIWQAHAFRLEYPYIERYFCRMFELRQSIGRLAIFMWFTYCNSLQWMSMGTRGIQFNWRLNVWRYTRRYIDGVVCMGLEISFKSSRRMSEASLAQW